MLYLLFDIDFINPLLLMSTFVIVLLKFGLKKKKGSWDNFFYERRVYESVDDSSLF